MPSVVRTLLIACLAFTTSAWSADWVSTHQVGSVVHFAIADPPQIARYDLSSRTWLSPFLLPTSRGPLSAVSLETDGLYVAYDKAVYRYTAAAQNELHVINVTTTVQSLFTDGNLLLINHSAGYYAKLTSVNRNDHTVITTFENYIDSVHGASIAKSSNRIFGTSWGISPADVAYVEYRNDGTFVGGGDSPHHGDYNIGTKTWVFPGEARFADSSGNCYSSSSLAFVLSFGTSITDLQFIGTDVPIILSGNKIVAYNNALLQTGSVTLSTQAKSIFVDGNAVLAFSSGPGSSIAVEPVLLSSISAPSPGQPVNAAELTFVPDDYFIDNSGVLNLFSKAHQNIFRWNPATQFYLAPIPLVGIPEFVTYSAQGNFLYTAYTSGLIRKMDLNATSPVEVPFVQMAYEPLGLAMAGSYLFASDEAGAWESHYTYTSAGALVSSKDWNYYSEEFIWNNATQKMYFFRDDTSPNDLLWEEINASGTAYPALAPGALGIIKDSPLHTSTGFIHPIRLAPDGSKVVLGSGFIHDASSLDRLPSGLANGFIDAVWLSSALLSARSVASDTTQFQQWLPPSFGVGQVLQTPGQPLRILAIPGGKVVAVNLGKDGAPSFYVMDDAFNIQAPPSLATPGRTAVRVASTTSVEFTWQDVSGESAYAVERRTLPSGTWQSLGTTTVSSNSYLDTSVQLGNSYAYRVKATNGSLASALSTPVEITFAVPGKPVLAATVEGSAQIRLNWNAPPRGLTYKVYRRTGSTTTWTLLTSTAISATTYLNTSLSPGTTYQYKLEAYNFLGVSEASDIASATTSLVAPSAPTLYAPSATNPREVTIQWTSVSLASSYLIERALVSNGTWSTLTTVTAPASQYLDKTVLPGTAYQYRMYALNAVGTSAASTVRQVTTPVPLPPSVPANLRSETLDGPAINLTWSDVTQEEGYRVERRVGEAAWTVLAILAPNILSYVDTGVTAGLDFNYRVVAFNTAGETATNELPVYVHSLGTIIADTFDPSINSAGWSDLQAATVRGSGLAGFYQGNALWMGGSGLRQAALAPVDISMGGAVLKFMFRAGNSSVDGVTYWDNSETSESIVVEYSKNGSTWTLLNTLNTVYPTHSTWTSYSVAVPAAAQSTTTRFRWRQLQHSGATFDTWAIDSVVVQGIVPAPPEVTPFFTGNANSSRSVALSWVSAARAASYEIQRRTPSTSWTTIGTSGLSQTYYTDSTAEPATYYSYRVIAKNAGGSSAPSDYVLISTWSTLAEWRFQNYGTLANTGGASSTADNGTGVPNLFKFAFNMAADDHFYTVQSTGGTKGMPLIQFQSEAGLLQVAFIRRRAEMNPGIQYHVQFSDDLSNWAAAGQEVLAAPINEDFEYVVWQDAPPAVNAPPRSTRFGRVTVTE